ncbi:MAG: hypothetical protein ABIW79_01135 [Gemmatimonas sp.]
MRSSTPQKQVDAFASPGSEQPQPAISRAATIPASTATAELRLRVVDNVAPGGKGGNYSDSIAGTYQPLAPPAA